MLARAREALRKASAHLSFIAPALLALVSFAAVAEALSQLTFATFGRDQAIFHYEGWALRHGRALWLVAVILFIPAAWRTGVLYANLRSSLEELFP